MKWDHSLSIGIKEIDDQHKQLVELTDHVEILFKKAIEGAGDFKETCEVVETLSNYAREHFMTEESLMEKIGYPGMDTHVEKHDAFVEFVSGMTYDKIQGNEDTVLIQLFAFLSNWIVDHIKTEDFSYKEFINQQ